MEDARRYVRDEGIPWTVVVDDLEGRVHQVYGGVADPTYLIDVDGRVAFYNIWTHAPSLERAISELTERGGRGVIGGGLDPVPHMLGALAEGWRGLERGLPQSYVDLETAAPGAATATFIGYHLRPVLAPLVTRSGQLPPRAKVGLGLGVAALGGLAAFLLLRRREA
jgi:hypothetical protein